MFFDSDFPGAFDWTQRDDSVRHWRFRTLWVCAKSGPEVLMLKNEVPGRKIIPGLVWFLPPAAWLEEVGRTDEEECLDLIPRMYDMCDMTRASVKRYRSVSGRGSWYSSSNPRNNVGHMYYDWQWVGLAWRTYQRPLVDPFAACRRLRL